MEVVDVDVAKNKQIKKDLPILSIITVVRNCEETIEKTILTFKGMLLDPRNGLEIKNAESLIEHKKNVNK